MSEVAIPKRPKRNFLPEDFKVTNWEALKPYFEQLLADEIGSEADLEVWLSKRSELESVISEDMGWRYIKMTCFTEDENYRKAYQDFVENIQPHMSPLSDQLNRKMVASPFLKALENKDGFDMMIRNVRKEIDLFREANIPLFTKINMHTQEYGQISGAMTVEIDGKELTLQQAGVMLMETNREKRESVYRSIAARRL